MTVRVEVLRASVLRSGIAACVRDWTPMATPMLWAVWSEAAPFVWSQLEGAGPIGADFRRAEPGVFDDVVIDYATSKVTALTDVQVAAVLSEVDGFVAAVYSHEKASRPSSAREYLNVLVIGMLERLVHELIAAYRSPVRRERDKEREGNE